VGVKSMILPMRCTVCEEQFLPTKNQLSTSFRNGRKRCYCSKECSQTYCRQLSSETMARTNRKYASARMKSRNPMQRKEIRAKVSMSLKERGLGPSVRGGNGKPLPVPQKMLADALGWITEHAVPTKIPKGNGYPTCYKLDIAFPPL